MGKQTAGVGKQSRTYAGATATGLNKRQEPVSRHNDWGPPTRRSPRVFARKTRTSIAVTLMRLSGWLVGLALLIAPWLLNPKEGDEG